MNAFMVYHQSADSWVSTPRLPIAVFLDEKDAEEYAKKQPGYGFNKDWFVKEVPFNPEA